MRSKSNHKFWIIRFLLFFNIIGTTVREGQFWHTSAEIEFPHQMFRGPHHFKPITRCHVALFDKMYLIYAKSDLHVG
jgi:hypothetical protein